MITRFAPSPTGFLHIGSLRTALFAWLAARSKNGKFFLRIEDTDLERSKGEYTDLIFKGLTWFGLDWDNSQPIIQSERLDLYRTVARQLYDSSQAYYCRCSKERLESLRQKQIEQKQPVRYDHACRDKNYGPSDDAVLRLKVPANVEREFFDHLHGSFTISSESIDDWILMRPGHLPTYNFCVVIDDNALSVDTVIRGDDHLNNTPKQVILYHMLSYPLAQYCHLPMILDEGGARLSKRTGNSNALDYQRRGILPEAMMNMLARLGWSHGDEEVFTKFSLLEKFSFSGLQKSPACLSDKKLLWLNKQHIALLNNNEIVKRLQHEGYFPHLDEKNLEQVVSIFKERVEVLADFESQSQFLFSRPKVSFSQALEQFPNYTPDIHAQVTQVIDQDRSFSNFFKQLKALAKDNNLKVPDIALPLRLLVCGTTQAPDFLALLKFLGAQEVLERLDCGND